MPVPWSARPAAVLVGLVLVSAPAAAQGTAEQRAACIGDAYRFCFSEIPNVARITACMESKLDQLSPACQAQFKPKSEGEAEKAKLKSE
jgi:hypothetical protein